MKSITESINSSLITESTKNVVMAFSHYTPGMTYIFTNVNLKKIPDWLDYDYENNPKNIVGFMHSDESPRVYSIAPNEAAMKRDCMKEINDHIKDCKPGDEIEELYPEMGGFYSWSDETYNGEKAPEIYKGIIDSIENSSICGDSDWVWGIVDIANQKTIVSGKTNITFVDDFDAWMHEMCDE